MTNIIIEQFNKDFAELQQLSKESEDLQKRFNAAAEKFNKKFKNAIFKSTAPTAESVYAHTGNVREPNSEWALYNVNGYSHNFKFNLFKIHKKCNYKLTQTEEYISIETFNSFLNFTGENIHQRQTKVGE